MRELGDGTARSGRRPEVEPHRLQLVLEAGDDDCDDGPKQPSLRLLGVARRSSDAAPTTTATGLPAGWKPGPIEIVAFEDGQCLIPGDVTEERRAELLRLAVEVLAPRERSETTCKTPEAKLNAMRVRLVDFGRLRGATALHVAGRLFIEHGESARRVLAATWTPAWGVQLVKVDAHLARAGLQAADTLPGLGL